MKNLYFLLIFPLIFLSCTKKTVLINENLDENGRSILFKAVENSDENETSKLISEGYDVNRTDLNGFTPLMVAVTKKNSAIIRKLIKAGADIDKLDTKNNTSPLLYAFHFDNLKAVEILVNSGADVSIKDYYGKNALMYACVSLDDSEISLLKKIIRKKDINSKDSGNSTPLMHAAGTGHLEAVKLLIKKGADINAVDNKGWTAYDYSFGEDKKAVREYFDSLK